MYIFPAIDLKNGQCVRLERGLMDKTTVFNHDPVKQAQHFSQHGFTHLHIVDLDGAFEGNSRNGHSIENIVKHYSDDFFIQLGGGIRSLQNIESWLNKGIDRVILGTIAARNPALVKKAAHLFPQQIAIGIDARDGIVAVEGWTKSEHIHATDLIQHYADCGIDAIIYTDIQRDGMMQGVNWEQTRLIAHKTSIPVIASGGVKDVHDIETLMQPDNQKIAGVIVGRALYEASFDIKKALSLTRNTHASKKIITQPNNT